MLHFTVQIPKEEVVPGMDKPEFWREETPGILNCALAGLHRLRTQGKFTEPAESSQAVEKLRLDANPARRFLLEGYQSGSAEEEYIVSSVLYQSYRGWCTHRGHYPLADNAFGNEVVRVFRSVVKKQKTVDGKRAWCYCGIRHKGDSAE